MASLLEMYLNLGFNFHNLIMEFVDHIFHEILISSVDFLILLVTMAMQLVAFMGLTKS